MANPLLTGILIDPFTKTVTEVQVGADISAWYKLLGCELLEVISIRPQVDLWIDEEGFFKTPPEQAYFYLNGLLDPIPGRALILSHDQAGESTSLYAKKADIEPHISWVNTEVPGFQIPQPGLPEIWELGDDFQPKRRLD